VVVLPCSAIAQLAARLATSATIRVGRHFCLLATWMKSYLLWPYPHDYTGKSMSCSLLWLDRTHYYLFVVLSIQLFKVKAQSNS
jgi:hypothetical protein